MLKILVTGSGSRYEVNAQGKIVSDDKFKSFCRAIGQALSKKKHQLFLLSDDERHADSYVIDGYYDAAKKNGGKLPVVKISYGSTSDPENRSAQKFARLRDDAHNKIEFEDFNAEGDYPFNRVNIVKNIDVVIVIGGQKGAKDVIEIAQALGKTIVPISSFEGTGARVWERLSADINRIARNKTDCLTKYFGDTSLERMDEIISIAELLSRANKNDSLVSYYSLLSIELICLVGWLLLYHTGSTYSQFSVFMMIVLMSTFGIVLRSLLKISSTDTSGVMLRAFLVEIGLGVGVGMVYFLFFQIGGASISHDVKTALQQENTFSSVSIIVSLLSVSASFLLEESIAKVTKKMTEALA